LWGVALRDVPVTGDRANMQGTGAPFGILARYAPNFVEPRTGQHRRMHLLEAVEKIVKG
jgi:hypothetical protein